MPLSCIIYIPLRSNLPFTIYSQIRSNNGQLSLFVVSASGLKQNAEPFLTLAYDTHFIPFQVVIRSLFFVIHGSFYSCLIAFFYAQKMVQLPSKAKPRLLGKKAYKFVSDSEVKSVSAFCLGYLAGKQQLGFDCALPSDYIDIKWFILLPNKSLPHHLINVNPYWKQ